MSWVQLSVEVAAARIDATMQALDAMGSQATTQENAGEESYFDLAHPAEPGWDRQKISGLFDAAEQPELLRAELKRRLPFVDQVDLLELEDRDWETAWLQQYEPIEVTPDLWIYPSWVDAPDNGAVVVRIDPGMAFGTGTHETTRLCMQLLAGLSLQDKTVLDYGCGSGILAIAALKLGAASAVGVDIDPKAEIVALENARSNGVESRFAIQSTRRVETQTFDIVVANILASALVDLSMTLSELTRRQGHIVLSGILSHQADEVVAAYQREFDFTRTEESGWVALLGLKKT